MSRATTGCEVGTCVHNVILKVGSRVGPKDELELLGCGLSKALWYAGGGYFFQKLWRTAPMADSAAGNESKGILTLVGTPSPRGMTQGGLLVVVEVVDVAQALSRRAERRRVI